MHTLILKHSFFRYKLLLDDIVKNTPRFHPDKNNLEEARTQIDAIAWYINDQIKACLDIIYLILYFDM